MPRGAFLVLAVADRRLADASLLLQQRCEHCCLPGKVAAVLDLEVMSMRG